MSTPSQKDVESMKNMQAIMNGDFASAPSVGTTNKDSESMKAILESFYSAGGDKLDNLDEVKRSVITEDVSEPTQSGTYSVSMSLVESEGKNKKKYSVVNESNTSIVSALTFQESASAIQKYLERGKKVHSDKIQTIIGLEEDYDRFRLESSKNKQHYDRCLELGEEEAADVFKTRFKAARAEAIAVKESIKAIEQTIR